MENIRFRSLAQLTAYMCMSIYPQFILLIFSVGVKILPEHENDYNLHHLTGTSRHQNNLNNTRDTRIKADRNEKRRMQTMKIIIIIINKGSLKTP